MVKVLKRYMSGKFAFPLCLLILLFFSIACGGGSGSGISNNNGNGSNNGNDNGGGNDNNGNDNEECIDSVNYKITFTSQWDATSHGSTPAFPSGAHFTRIVGATHNSDVTFWAVGELATKGIENVAELGITTNFSNEVSDAITAGHASEYIQGGSSFISTTAPPVIFEFDANEEFPLLTLITMIAPSTDWFVGVSGLNLRSSNNECWRNDIKMDLMGYDAGTEDDTDPVMFSLVGMAANPVVPIGPIMGLPQDIRAIPFATLRLELKD